MNTCRPQKGFSLIETVVVVAIIALLAVAAAPSFTDTRDRNYVKSASEQFLGRLADVRLEAMKRNEVVEVDFDDLIAEFGAERGVTVSDPTYGTLEIEPKLGMLVDTSSAGYVDIQRGNFTLRFGVSPIGQGYICGPVDGNAGYPPCDS